MALTERQKELDLIKWEKSQLLKMDACGSFDYCRFCNKSNENPCDTAYGTMKGEYTEVVATEDKPAKKSTAKKSTTTKTDTKKTTKTTSKKSTKTVEKKATTKKSTTKKITTKKTK